MEFAIIPDIATYSVGDSLIAELLYCLLETSDVLWRGSGTVASQTVTKENGKHEQHDDELHVASCDMRMCSSRAVTRDIS
jgi:hypothetical protein